MNFTYGNFKWPYLPVHLLKPHQIIVPLKTLIVATYLATISYCNNPNPSYVIVTCVAPNSPELSFLQLTYHHTRLPPWISHLFSAWPFWGPHVFTAWLFSIRYHSFCICILPKFRITCLWLISLLGDLKCSWTLYRVTCI